MKTAAAKTSAWSPTPASLGPGWRARWTHWSASTGKPVCIVSDNGTEFTSKAIPKWANSNKVERHYIDPGKPQQNGDIESFNGSLRPSHACKHALPGNERMPQ